MVYGFFDIGKVQPEPITGCWLVQDSLFIMIKVLFLKKKCFKECSADLNLSQSKEIYTIFYCIYNHANIAVLEGILYLVPYHMYIIRNDKTLILHDTC